MYDQEGMMQMRLRRECEFSDEGDAPSEREKAHAEIEAKVAEFLAAGGAIEKVDSGTCVLRECGKSKGRSTVLKALKSREMAARKNQF